MLRWLAIVVAALIIGLFAFTKLVAPPNQLNILNTLMLGDSSASRVAEGVVFDKANGMKLDVWVPKQKGAAKLPVLVFSMAAAGMRGSARITVLLARPMQRRALLLSCLITAKCPKCAFLNLIRMAPMRCAGFRIMLKNLVVIQSA